AQNQIAAQASTTAVATLERIVKKLKKLTAVVVRSRPSSVAVAIDAENCAITATAMATAIATLSTDQMTAPVRTRPPYRRVGTDQRDPSIASRKACSSASLSSSSATTPSCSASSGSPVRALVASRDARYSPVASLARSVITA